MGRRRRLVDRSRGFGDLLAHRQELTDRTVVRIVGGRLPLLPGFDRTVLFTPLRRPGSAGQSTTGGIVAVVTVTMTVTMTVTVRAEPSAAGVLVAGMAAASGGGLVVAVPVIAVPVVAVPMVAVPMVAVPMITVGVTAGQSVQTRPANRCRQIGGRGQESRQSSEDAGQGTVGSLMQVGCKLPAAAGRRQRSASAETADFHPYAPDSPSAG